MSKSDQYSVLLTTSRILGKLRSSLVAQTVKNLPAMQGTQVQSLGWEDLALDPRLPASSVHGDSPGKNTGVDCHALLQGIFPTQGSNPGLLHCKRILDCLSHQGSPHKVLWIPNIPVSLQGNSEIPGVSREVPCSVLKCETVLDTLMRPQKFPDKIGRASCRERV